MDFYSLDDGNQEKLIYPAKVNLEWVNQTKEKYSWGDYSRYDNMMWEYMYKLFDEMVSESGAETYDELWFKLNRPQKTFWAFLAFNGDTDNGGVYQFIFNRPQFIFAVAEMWKEIGFEKLAQDYNEVLEELSAKTDKLSQFKDGFNDESKAFEERWSSFAEGYDELPSTQNIQSYYYDDEFKKVCHQKVADYIDMHMDKFVKK